MTLFGLVFSFLGGLLMAVPYLCYGRNRDRLMVFAAQEHFERPPDTAAPDTLDADRAARLDQLKSKGENAVSQTVIDQLGRERAIFGAGLVAFTLGQALQLLAALSFGGAPS